MLVIRKYPDPVLSRRARSVQRIDTDLRKLVEGMFETMYGDRGVGLAAPQVGESIRVCVINPKGKEGENGLVLVNPVLVDSSGEVCEEEGCLSVPGVRSKVTRFVRVRVKAYDLDGREMDIEAEGLEARILQHEMDHLNGRLFFERLNEAARMTLNRQLKALEDDFEAGKR